MTLLFVHIPKTAGTSIRKTLADAGVHDRLMKHPQGKKYSPAQFSKHTSAEAYRRYYGDIYDKAHTFAVVRNPLDWLWSFFRFIKWTDISPDTGKPWRHQIYKQVAPLDFAGFVDFVCADDGFAHLSCSKKLRAVGIPQFTQAAFVSDPSGKRIVQSIFRFERLQDLPEWLSSVGVEVPGLVLLNVSRKASSDDVYTARMQSIVEQRFAADFDLWESTS
jgi:hypothetical protein